MRRIALVALLALLAACAGGDTPPTSAPQPSAGAPTATAARTPVGTPQAIEERVDVAFGDAIVSAEVADEATEQRTGLMHRTSLPPDDGMLFVFGAKHQGGFWMKNTLIPLSIAYMASTGQDAYEVVTIADMEPCTTPTCPTYPPDGPYDAALEVNQGWFDEHGVEEGDTATVSE